MFHEQTAFSCKSILSQFEQSTKTFQAPSSWKAVPQGMSETIIVNFSDTRNDASMDAIYVTYNDDEHIDNHGYDVNTGDDRDRNSDI